MSAPNMQLPGIWQELFPPALALMKHLESMTVNPPWTFGGGTVLMLRIGHRQSKDIDLFVPDPQYLGYVNPRLSDVAEQVSSNYDENAEYIKLFLEKGVIDIVVGMSLTANPHELVEYEGRQIRVETCAEIIAKKMWHRGYMAKARDLFDLAAVASLEPEAIGLASPFFVRHGARFLERVVTHEGAIRADFDQIDTLTFRESFDYCEAMARDIIEPLLA